MLCLRGRAGLECTRRSQVTWWAREGPGGSSRTAGPPGSLAVRFFFSKAEKAKEAEGCNSQERKPQSLRFLGLTFGFDYSAYARGTYLSLSWLSILSIHSASGEVYDEYLPNHPRTGPSTSHSEGKSPSEV